MNTPIPETEFPEDFFYFIIGADPPSLASQAAAVRRAAVNLPRHCDNLRDLVAPGKRPKDLPDLLISERWLPALAAAADTLENMAKK
jgi:hypothetical protein